LQQLGLPFILILYSHFSTLPDGKQVSVIFSKTEMYEKTAPVIAIFCCRDYRFLSNRRFSIYKEDIR